MNENTQVASRNDIIDSHVIRMMEDLVERSRDAGVSVNELLADVVAQSLMSHDDHPAHIHWITFHDTLGTKLKNIIQTEASK